MKTIKIMAGTLAMATFLMLGAMQANLFAANKPSARTQQVNLKVAGMSCPYCSSSLKSSLRSIKGAKDVMADYRTGCASFDCPASAKVTTAQIKTAVTKAGFTLKDVKFVEKPAQQTKNLKQVQN